METDKMNELFYILGPFVGLGDDADLYQRFTEFDNENTGNLVTVVEEFLVDWYKIGDAKNIASGMAVLKEISLFPRAEAEDLWETLLPPFSYPETINFFKLIFDTLNSYPLDKHGITVN